ncbi:hypothetical protein [Anaeromyxobacter oryzae]|uniref:Uncharacterized protein n=1 Tax=Anaeromyxobacter oryzae TaxID=2918170 RepID=A0ABM7X2R0_9BACT|nr:hypothetical protein [Anaeromyxobacter oryzae]BDG06079.1 hypothetical protein AMOR_50750 [Anaeromyxobacter oryzae]
MIAWKFLAEGGIAPFTGFRWPADGGWVGAPAERSDVWIHACRLRDLPHWLGAELWTVELTEPVQERRYQVVAPRGRLLGRVTAWDGAAAGAYARACALRARDLALPHLEPALRDALAGAAELEAIVAAASPGGPEPAPRAALLVADAARYALRAGRAPVAVPATAAYIVATLASTVGDGLAAFEAERAWQARWLEERLGLADRAAPLDADAPVGFA